MRGVTDDAPARNPAAHEPRVLLSRAQRTLRNCKLCEAVTRTTLARMVKGPLRTSHPCPPLNSLYHSTPWTLASVHGIPAPAMQTSYARAA